MVRQCDETFSAILTRIGDGKPLSEDQILLIESRFRTEDWCNENVKEALRLFHTNASVDAYHRAVVVAEVHSIAVDTYTGYTDTSQLANARGRVHGMPTTKTANMAYDVPLAVGRPYMISTNIDLKDGLVNGAIGVLRYIEYRPVAEVPTCDDNVENSSINCLWLDFDDIRIGRLSRLKCRSKVVASPVLGATWTPIYRRKATFTVSGSVKCRRTNFPPNLACAMTTHKSQGGTFDSVVIEYNRFMQQQLVYVALSRVKTLEGLFLFNCLNDMKFYHGIPVSSPTLVQLQTELQRLHAHPFQTLDAQHLRRLEAATTSVLIINVQSLSAHCLDIQTDAVLMQAGIFCLTETWVENGNVIEIDGYHLSSQNKRAGKTGGVAIYVRDTMSVPTLHCSQPMLCENEVGDICVSEFEDAVCGFRCRLVCIYISPNTCFNQLTSFLEKYRVLLAGIEGTAS